MERFLEKSIQHVRRIFPNVYSSRPRRGSFHFSLALERSTIVAVGLNCPDKVNAKALQFAQRLGLKEKIKYSYIHAEENMISKLIGMDKLCGSLKIVVLRMNRFGELCESKPCDSCQQVLTAYGLNRIFYSTRDGEICSA